MTHEVNNSSTPRYWATAQEKGAWLGPAKRGNPKLIPMMPGSPTLAVSSYLLNTPFNSKRMDKCIERVNPQVFVQAFVTEVA